MREEPSLETVVLKKKTMTMDKVPKTDTSILATYLLHLGIMFFE
jgi:hypothetical protein